MNSVLLLRAKFIQRTKDISSLWKSFQNILSISLHQYYTCPSIIMISKYIVYSNENTCILNYILSEDARSLTVQPIRFATVDVQHRNSAVI